MATSGGNAGSNCRLLAPDRPSALRLDRPNDDDQPRNATALAAAAAAPDDALSPLPFAAASPLSLRLPHNNNNSNSNDHLLVVPQLSVVRRMSACGDRTKKKHPQLLRLTPKRAQSCADFGHRVPPAPTEVPMLPSSLAAAALSAKRIHESGGCESPLFVPYQRPQPGAPSPAAYSHHPSSDSGSCSAPPTLSPPRKGSRSSRLCYSFRRTLRRPGAKRPDKLLNDESDSNPSNLAGADNRRCSDAASSHRAADGSSLASSEQTSAFAFPSTEESQMLAKAWQRKESRIAIPDPKQPTAGGSERLAGAGSREDGTAAGGGDQRGGFSLRRLSKAFFQAQELQKIDLMNDWEIGGTQNPWVCPSDRHLQLRAQLKSGWSVRTATARSPTTSKQAAAALQNGISEAEQEHIQKVLARAEAGRQNEQIRICKMMERLERLRARATGNGVTQCLLCQTEFGLLAAKSYAAMCSDCRKYVCQKNCGVETFDNQKGKPQQPIFLCKICSEYREVMWKKSGAWFYRELPLPSSSSSRPASAMAGSSSMANGGTPSAPFLPPSDSPSLGRLPLSGGATPQGSHTGPMPRRHFGDYGGAPPLGGGDGGARENRQQRPSRAEQQQRSEGGSRTERNRQLPIPTEQQQRLKTTPRPRIIPSWVHEGLQQSSMSVDDSDGDSASSSTSSSLEPAQFRKSLGAAKERALAVKQRAVSHVLGNNVQSTAAKIASTTSARSATNRTAAGSRNKGATGTSTTAQGMPSQMQRVTLGRGRVSDSDESENERDDVSRRSSPSTSPRHSLATPSSYGGDDLLGDGRHNGQGGGGMGIGGGPGNGRETAAEHTMSDSRSVDSGVVQSDHSAQQQAIMAGGLAAAAFAMQQQNTPVPPEHYAQQRLCAQSPSPIPPPIPPRSATIAVAPLKPPPLGAPIPDPVGTAQQLAAFSAVNPPVSRRPASAVAVSRPHKTGPTNSHSSHESIPSVAGSAELRRMGASRMHEGGPSNGSASDLAMHGALNQLSLTPEPAGSRRSTASTVPPMDVCKEEEQQLASENEHGSTMAGAGGRDSPTFMSSPEEDSSTLGSIQFNLTYLANDKQLIIHLIRAKNLKAMDKNGFSDPYVKFHLLPGNAKATKLTSRTIEKTLNPEWNEEMIYYGITEEERLRKILRVTVLDRDRIGSDFLGETRVALRKLPPGQQKKFNLYLEHAMPITAADEKTDGAGAERGKLLLSVQYNIQQGSLFVTVKRCAELLGMDSTGFSDPYCKVSLTPLASKAHRQKTTIKKRTLNPEFNETMQFIIPFKDLPKKTLEVGVYDYDVGRHDDYIGGIVLSTAAPGERGRQWQQVIENPGKTFEQWHKLVVD